MKRLENLYALTEIGRRLGELEAKLLMPRLGDVATVCLQVKQSLRYILADNVVPISAVREPAEALLSSIEDMTSGRYLKENWVDPPNAYLKGVIISNINRFQIAVCEELRYLFFFVLEPKGNLSIGHLVAGASAGDAPPALALLDQAVKREINEAGRCLAFAFATAAGFHVLRSVEMVAKGYLLAANGSLPSRRRNWGEYIAQLENVGASSDVIDLLRDF